jgi:hypothetical protein
MQNPIIYQNLASVATGGLLFYAISQHLVAQSTSLMCSAVNHNLLIEIAILLVTMLALFALYTLWLFFKPLFIVGVICVAAVTWYATSDDLKPVKISTPSRKEVHHYQQGG